MGVRGGEIGGAAKAQGGGALAGLERGAQGLAHEGGVVAGVGGSCGGPAAEEILIAGGVGAGFAGDHGGVEVVHPFPNQPVEPVCAVQRGASGGDGGQHLGRGSGEPGVEILFEGGFVSADGRGVTGGCGEFPLGEGWQALGLRAGIGAGGEPGDVDHGGVGRGGGAGVEVAGPVAEIRFVGEKRGDAGAAPLRVGGDEGEKLGVGDGQDVEVEGYDRNEFRVGRGAGDGAVVAGGDEHGGLAAAQRVAADRQRQAEDGEERAERAREAETAARHGEEAWGFGAMGAGYSPFTLRISSTAKASAVLPQLLAT